MYRINFIPKYVNTYIISIDIIKLLHDTLNILIPLFISHTQFILYTNYEVNYILSNIKSAIYAIAPLYFIM